MKKGIEAGVRVLGGAFLATTLVTAAAELGGAAKEGLRRKLRRLQEYDAGNPDAFSNPNFGKGKPRSRHASRNR